MADTKETSYLPDKPDPLIGATVAGRYAIEKKLGEGGMGSVYLATHTLLEKQVALKILHGEFARKPELVERFMQEAKAASRIRHENVIEISDFGTTPDGMVFFAMELLRGRDLHDLITRSRLTGEPFAWARAKHIFLQVCGALGAAHAKGIIHRDLKPENVYLIEFLGDPDFVKLLDFGIAKLTDVQNDEGARKLTKTGMLFGTPEYMSPEQARGERVDHRVDIYAMGCILFQMITGRVPFTADNFMGVLALQLTEAPPVIPPETFDYCGAPREIAGVIDRALAKDRDERYQTTDELAEAVREVAGDDIAPGASMRSRSPSGGPLRARTPSAAPPMRSRTPSAAPPMRSKTPSAAPPMRGRTPTGEQQPRSRTPSAQPLRARTPTGQPLRAKTPTAQPLRAKTPTGQPLRAKSPTIEPAPRSRPPSTSPPNAVPADGGLPAEASGRTKSQWTGHLRVPEIPIDAIDTPHAPPPHSRAPFIVAGLVVLAGLGGVGWYILQGQTGTTPSAAGSATGSAGSSAPVTPPPPPPPEPKLPDSVRITLDTVPPGASVTDLAIGKPIGKTPVHFTVPGSKAPRSFTLHLDGYADETLELVPDRDVEHQAKLEKGKSGPAGGKVVQVVPDAVIKAVPPPDPHAGSGSGSAAPAPGEGGVTHPVTHAETGGGSAATPPEPTPPKPPDPTPPKPDPTPPKSDDPDVVPIKGFGSGSP